MIVSGIRTMIQKSCVVLVCVLVLAGSVWGKDIYIIHGYKSDSKYGWFNSVAENLKKQGHKVVVLNLPNADKPTLKEWLEAMQKDITHIDNDTYFITHSLGGVATLHFLSSTFATHKIHKDSQSTKGKGTATNQHFQVGGVVLVAPFDEELKVLPIFGSFTDKKPNYQLLQSIIKDRIVISAKNDTLVPTRLSQKLAKSLNAEFIQTPTGGHFMESEGYTDLPLIIEVFQNLDRIPQ